jgi:glycosyltransferase involved in cell wall biosynthesis
VKNVLILSNYLPNQGWGGGVIIRSLTNDYPKNIKLLWTTFRTKNSKNETLNNIEILGFQTKLFRARGKFKAVLYLETLLFVKNFISLLKKNKVDILWIVLGTSYLDLYRIEKLSRQLDIPFHISIHDDPILEIKTDRVNADDLFQKILNRAKSIDVISERMKNDYQKKYDVNSIVITRCIDDNFPTNSKINSQTINVLMAGFGNASSPWPKPIITAIEALNVNQNFQLKLFDPKLKHFENEFIKVFDLLDENQFNVFLQTTNLGYACDDLNPEKVKFAQLSLPTKIITYIGAQIPFVYHGPKDSTVADLLTKYPVGIIVETNNPKDLQDAFLALLANYSFYQENCKLATKTLFSKNVMQDKFYATLTNILD